MLAMFSVMPGLYRVKQDWSYRMAQIKVPEGYFICWIGALQPMTRAEMRSLMLQKLAQYKVLKHYKVRDGQMYLNATICQRPFIIRGTGKLVTVV